MNEANSGPGRVTREQRGQLFLIGLDRAGKRNARHDDHRHAVLEHSAQQAFVPTR